MKESLRRIGSVLLRRVADEAGIALVMAMLVTTSLAIMTTTVLYFSASSSRTSSRTSGDQEAYALAEAGINTAIAKIYGAADPRVTSILSPAVTVPKCPGSNSTELPHCYSTGSVTYSGTLDKTHGNTWFWTITSTGSVPVNGVSTVVRKLTRSVGVTGNNGTDGSSWTRFYQDNPSTTSCLTLDSVTVPTNFASRGCIKLINGATVTGATTNINAGGSIFIDPTTPGDPGTATGWTNSTYAGANDTNYATSGNLTNNTNSASLTLTNFGLAIPSMATISGITVSVYRHASANSSTNYIWDNTVQLLKAGVAGGSNEALTAAKWPTTDGAQAYGATNDMWGTTWTPAQVNASNFGLKLIAHSTCTGTNCNVLASVNYVLVTVYFSTGAAIGSSGTPILQADVGAGCLVNGVTPVGQPNGAISGTAHSPCAPSDKVYATTSNATLPANNPALSMPVVDWNYWWANAMPGPKHFCTNANPGLPTNFFDNNAGTTSAPDASVTVNGEMAPPGSPYDCEVWVNGVLQGMIKWDGSHRLDIYGTIFVDGNFRFDDDGEIVHYFGRGTLMSSHDDEIDALVCAGGVGNTYGTSCAGGTPSTMNTWSPSQNMMVLMSECLRGKTGCNEYDQGGTSCSGSKPNCWDGHLVGGFQGILYSLGECLIHQEFQDSGPVICDTINMPNESGLDPTYFSFPSVGNLTNGMSFSSTSSATDFSLNVSAQGDG